MQTITEDKWEEEVWGAATSAGTNRYDTASRNLFIYWGQNVGLSSKLSQIVMLTMYSGQMGR